MSEPDDIAGGPPLLPELGGEPPAAPPAHPLATEDEEPVWTALLRNRLLLTGASAVVVLVLVALVLIAIGRGEGPVDTQTVAGATTPDPASDGERDGVTATVRTTTSMRNGPGPTYQILGTIPRNATVAVVGRNEDQTWLQVVWPPGSALRGWISIAFAQVTGDVAALAVAGPGQGPSVDLPTGSGPLLETPGFVATPPPPDTTPDATAEPTRTRQPTEPLRTAPPTRTPTVTLVPPPPTITTALEGGFQ